MVMVSDAAGGAGEVVPVVPVRAEIAPADKRGIAADGFGGAAGEGMRVAAVTGNGVRVRQVDGGGSPGGCQGILPETPSGNRFRMSGRLKVVAPSPAP